MRWLILAVSLCFAGYQAAEIGTGITTNEVSENNGGKGFIEWVVQLIGGSTTSSPVINDPELPAIDCPACQCGVARTKRRIVGGHETNEREYPWMAMLLYNGRMFCGGSLINDRYVMTAAHCTGFRKERMTVRLLEHDITKHGNKTKIIDRKVAKVIRHLRYDTGTYDNDIALLKLSERIDLSNAIKKRLLRADEVSTPEAEPAVTTTPELAVTTTPEPAVTEEEEPTTAGPTIEEEDVSVRPVCLPAPGLSYMNECGLVTGWGVTEQGGSLSNALQEVKVPIVSNMECSDRSYGMRVTANMLCAGEPDGGRDACQGDSGGPLHIFNETTGRYHEVGVVSWGEGCALPSKYGVYSRVNRYLTWIKSNTADACYCDSM